MQSETEVFSGRKNRGVEKKTGRLFTPRLSLGRCPKLGIGKARHCHQEDQRCGTGSEKVINANRFIPYTGSPDSRRGGEECCIDYVRMLSKGSLV